MWREITGTEITCDVILRRVAASTRLQSLLNAHHDINDKQTSNMAAEDAVGPVGNLESEALKRKQRLQALKNRKRGDLQPTETNADAERNKESLPKPVFRSYCPHDENLKENVLPKAKASDLEDHVKKELESTKSKPVIEGLDLTNLAPRKPDWDLKRDVAKKLEKLERQTQRAIVELIRARLKETDGEDLAAAVNIGARANETVSIDDE